MIDFSFQIYFNEHYGTKEEGSIEHFGRHSKFSGGGYNQLQQFHLHLVLMENPPL